MADHPFPLRPVRLVRIGWKYWDAVCAVETGGGQTATTIGCQAQGITEELQAFGTGYPLAVTLRSQILDLQGLKNFTNLEWEGETPPGTRHEIRTRTGNDLNSVITFHNKDGKEITERAWGKRIPSFRGSIDTTFGVGDDWSPWSRIYHTSAQAFQSPVPRRMFKSTFGWFPRTRKRQPVSKCCKSISMIRWLVMSSQKSPRC